MNPNRGATLVLSGILALGVWLSAGPTLALEIQFAPDPANQVLQLAADQSAAPILAETSNDRAVLRAISDLAADFSRVTGRLPEVQTNFANPPKTAVMIGTIGQSRLIDQLIAAKKLDASGVSGKWESYVLQVVEQPLPGVERALVIAGSDRRGTIFGIYDLSERLGVSPWNWWADVPVPKHKFISVSGPRFVQGPPAVKYRGIFLNDEDYGLRPWASQTFDPQTGNIGPKTYAKVFELLLRLRANCLWPAMHPGTRAFNFFPEAKELADRYGIVMGSSHCEQMLRNNVDEWDTAKFGEYNYVNNRAGVLQYWEQRVRENAAFDSLYTLGMRGVHDGAMPGGGTQREKAARLHQIIADQRELLARLVNPNLADVPQIFCPYKEVLPLYRLAPEIPDDITLVWPDDNFGYIRQFSNERERQRSGGAGVYYHISYWGAPYNYLWLYAIAPALIAEEMTKAYDYGANRVWIVNVGDLKPGEIGMEFFLRLAWNPHQLDNGQAEDLLLKMAARDFGPELAPAIVTIWNEYFRLNQPRKPDHMGFDEKNWLLRQPAFSTTLNGDEVAARLAAWQSLVSSLAAVEAKLPAESRDAWFELVGYPVQAAAAANEKALALTRAFAASAAGQTNAAPFLAAAQSAQAEIARLTKYYNEAVAGGKWNRMMSDHPGNLAVFKISTTFVHTNVPAEMAVAVAADGGHRLIIEAEHASAFVPGTDAKWKILRGLGYNGAAVAVFPTTVRVRATPEKILAESPCLQFKTMLPSAGDWKVTLRTLPTFSVETGKPQRYAIAFDAAPPQIIALAAGTDEKDRSWQENVLRNAAITSSRHSVETTGEHTLKIWMVDPGIVIDTLAVESGNGAPLGLQWPAETRVGGVK
jgi:hypothetical protein